MLPLGARRAGDCGGGRLVIVAESVTDSLKTSKFSFLVLPLSGIVLDAVE